MLTEERIRQICLLLCALQPMMLDKWRSRGPSESATFQLQLDHGQLTSWPDLSPSTLPQTPSCPY
jgi:hypothetical protein